MTTQIQVQFAKPGNPYRLEVSVSPLLAREVAAVVEEFTANWTKPEEVDRAKVNDATALILTADHDIHGDQRPSDVARKLSYAIWKRLDRYVKVTVEATYLGENPDTHFEFAESQYAEAYGARFEN
jgi:hypothetical protein